MTTKTAAVHELLRHTGLVVLDPDDIGQMEHLAALHDQAWQIVRDRNPDRVGTPTWEIWAQALRLLIDPNPPKPDEPLGLGAVIEDVDGLRWVRVDGDDYPWFAPESRDFSAYKSIDVAKIYTLGVES